MAYRTRLARVAGLLVAIAAAIYFGAVAYLFAFQRDHVFEPSGALIAPAEEGLEKVEVVELEASDGTNLTGWYGAGTPGLPTVLYFHGNSGNVSGRADRFRQILDSGFGVLAFSYRGYAGSGGSPSESALLSDALEIFDWLAGRTDNIVIYGESLGTAVATYVAAERPVRALVLEAPFTAALDIAADVYPWVPVGLLMRDPFLTRETIVRVEEPVLIVHGTEDTVVPVAHGRRLFEFAHEPKTLSIIEGAGHSNLWRRGLWPTVLEFLAQNGAET
jgi:fermentation-respiration switch protein FrsA (DUF1100 family)